MVKAPKFDLKNYLNKSSQPHGKIEADQSSPVKWISVYDLVPNPQNFYELNDIEGLETAIELQGGITTSLEVKVIDNNKYMIIAGHRRRQAVVNLLANKSDKLKSDKVPCIVQEYTPEQEVIALVFSNRYQRVRSKEEESKEFQLLKPILKNLYEEAKRQGTVNGRFRKFCADFFDVSESTIHRMESMEKLAPEIKEELQQGKITPTAAMELTALSAAEQKAVYEDTKGHGATVKAVQDKKKEIVLHIQPEMSELEIKVFAVNEVRTMIIREIEKIPASNQDFGRVTVSNIKLDRLTLLKQVLEDELNSLSGENMFSEVGSITK